MEDAVTVISRVEEFVPPGPVGTKVTVNTPVAVYVFVGEASVEVVPSPKLQEYEVAFSEVLVNCISSPTSTLVLLAVNDAVGFGLESSLLQDMSAIKARNPTRLSSFFAFIGEQFRLNE